MTFEGIIATPFGYILNFIYSLFGNYGVSLILFAVIVQMIMVPLDAKNRRSKENKRRLDPVVAKIREEYKDTPDKQIDLIADLYKKEKVSLAGNFILSILPFFILLPIFQVVAQPITYIFHEEPETSAKIVAAMREANPNLFTSSYQQFTAIANIADYADIVKAAVPEVSARTLEGLNCSFLGLELTAVPGIYIIGKSVWVWDWPHVGAILFPVVYMGRRIYLLVAGIIRKYSAYAHEKKLAVAAGVTPPRLPNPPVIQMFFLLLSLTAMSAVPISMNLYWLAGGLAASGMNKLAAKLDSKKTKTTGETASVS